MVYDVCIFSILNSKASHSQFVSNKHNETRKSPETVSRLAAGDRGSVSVSHFANNITNTVVVVVAELHLTVVVVAGLECEHGVLLLGLHSRL